MGREGNWVDVNIRHRDTDVRTGLALMGRYISSSSKLDNGTGCRILLFIGEFHEYVFSLI